MELSKALQKLVVLDTQGFDFHYTSCAIYYQGLITVRKLPDDPTKKCNCGRDEAIATIFNSSVGRHLVQLGAKQPWFKREKVIRTPRAKQQGT
jgi:hypothetical protein